MLYQYVLDAGMKFLNLDDIDEKVCTTSQLLCRLIITCCFSFSLTGDWLRNNWHSLNSSNFCCFLLLSCQTDT